MSAPLAGLLALAIFAHLLASDRTLARLEWPDGTTGVHELEQLRTWLKPGMPLLLLPPRRYAVHYFLGTRADGGPLTYFWDSPDPARATRLLAEVQDVVVVHAMDESDVAAELESGVAAAVAHLEGAGFVRLFSGPSLEMWRKPVR